jgi:hypothetical protein
MSMGFNVERQQTTILNPRGFEAKREGKKCELRKFIDLFTDSVRNAINAFDAETHETSSQKHTERRRRRKNFSKWKNVSFRSDNGV